jgi:hypothetical protein
MGKISPEKLEAMRSINVLGALPSKPRVKEWTDPASGRMKATKDELGNVVTQHARGDRQDVLINAQPVHLKTGSGLAPANPEGA